MHHLVSRDARKLSARRTTAGLVAAAFLTCAAPASAGVALSTSGWEWSDPVPQGYALQALSFQGQTGFAVGVGGTALRTTDGGETFTGLFTGTGLKIGAIDLAPTGLALSTVTADNRRCSLLVSKDGGATFTRVLIGSSESSCSGNQITAFDFVTGDLGYIMREGGAVLKTTDGGASLGNASTVDGGKALAFVTDSKGFALGAGGIYRTTDGAQTWSLTRPATGLSSIRAFDENTLIAWGGGSFLRSTDAGDTWSELPGLTGTPEAISTFGTQRIAYVVGGKLILSDDGGATAKTVTVGNSDILAAAFVSETRIVAVGTAGVTYVSTDGGATFARTSSDPVAPQLVSLVGTAGGPVGLGFGKIGRLVDGRWRIRATLSGDKVASADFSSATNGYALHIDGSLVRTTDGGVTWSRVDAGTPTAPRTVMTPNNDTVVLFGSFGTYRATAGGSFTKIIKAPNGRGRWSADHAGARIAYATATGQRRNLAFGVSADAGKTWHGVSWPKSMPLPIDAVTVLPGKGLLATAGGRLWRSASDKGTSWAEVVLGQELTNDGVEASSATEYFAKTDATWGTPTVLHTTNAGKTWQPQAVGAYGSGITDLESDGAGRAFAISLGDKSASLFQTTTGGQRGAASTISVSRTAATLTRVSGSTIQVVGQLKGGVGGEQVRVAIRKVGQRGWQSTRVTVGANGGGSFTANFSRIKKGQYQVIAGWAGDSGRAGAMTQPKLVTVR